MATPSQVRKRLMTSCALDLSNVTKHAAGTVYVAPNGDILLLMLPDSALVALLVVVIIERAWTIRPGSDII